MSHRIIWEQGNQNQAVERVLLRVAEELDTDIQVSGRNGQVYQCRAEGMTGRELFEALKLKAEASLEPPEGDGRNLTSIVGGAAQTDGVIMYEGETQNRWKWCRGLRRGLRVRTGVAVISTSMSLFRDFFVFA
ncbi:MAG: hypothetical protein HY820_12065 [Acidobacteria bacterium]|nr:hypothetical protein [Acidobacteriota bacterium]